MLQSNQKTSLLVPYQLPEFVSSNPDYSNFVAFLQAYYEWLETADTSNSTNTMASSGGQGITYGSKNILNYTDIDTTIDDFLSYYINDFLPYFPTDALISKQKAIKVARQLYESKGTPASYQFLFRILYNSDFNFFKTGDTTLKASTGVWYVAISLQLETDDKKFLNLSGYRVFGETSKSFATIENSVLTETKIQIFISNIEREFQSGEYIRIVDDNNQDIIVNGSNLRTKIVGQISQINLARNSSGIALNRGTLYEVGDPVVVYGGLNPNTSNPVGAVAEVSAVTSGAITGISVDSGGFGFGLYPNTILNITNAPGANAIVYSLNPVGEANVVLFPTDSIFGKQSVTIGNSAYHFVNNSTANANTSLANALHFISFSTYPISSVDVVDGGGGISVVPQVSAYSVQPNDYNQNAFLSSLGILAPVQITNGGIGYYLNDTITFTGGTGHGAYANVTSISGSGAITGVSYVYKPGESAPHHYALGGMGYNPNYLPTLNVVSQNVSATGASLYVPGILGSGATFSVATQKIGSVTSISLTNNGEDYVSTPNVSLSVQDILVSNVNVELLPQNGDIVYQGLTAETASYESRVYSTTLLIGNLNTYESLYNLRVYNYNTQPLPSSPLIISGKNIIMKMANTSYPANYFHVGSPIYNSSGVKNYGDGTAQAVASFLNGLVYSQGQYLNTAGQPSSYDVLESENYNGFTYQITVEKEIAKYRDILLNLLHPSGTKLIGRYELKSNANFEFTAVEALYGSKQLASYTGTENSNVSITTDFTNQANNKVKFYNLAGANLSTFIFTNQIGIANSVLQITTPNGPNIRSEVYGVDYVSNVVTLKESTWLTYANVAFATANANSNVINITSITGSYNVINNGIFSNTAYPLYDIVYAGDKVQLNNSTYIVSSVDYVDGIVYTTSNVISNVNSSLLSVNRTYNSKDVVVIGPVGLEYIPEITTENGITITTENGQLLVLE